METVNEVKVSYQRLWLKTENGRALKIAQDRRYYEKHRDEILLRQRAYQKIRYAAKKEALLTNKAVVV